MDEIEAVKEQTMLPETEAEFNVVLTHVAAVQELVSGEITAISGPYKMKKRVKLSIFYHTPEQVFEEK